MFLNLESFFSTELLQRIGGTLLHSLWEITILALLYLVLSRVLSNRWVRLRYALGFGVLLSMLIVPLCTAFWIPSQPPQIPVVRVENVEPQNPENPESTDVPPDSDLEVDSAEKEKIRDEENREIVEEFLRALGNPTVLGRENPGNEPPDFPEQTDSEPEEISVLLSQFSPQPDAELTDFEPQYTQPQHAQTRHESEEISHSAISDAAIPSATGTLSQNGWEYLNARILAPLLPFAAGAWLIGVVIFSVRLICEWFSLHALKKDALQVLDGLWFEQLQSLCENFGLKTNIRLAYSERIDSPILIGIFKPMILLPMSLLSGFSPNEIEVILAHELAHIRRYDYLANLVQLSVETLLFYHPLVWWVSRSIRRDREFICDDELVDRHGTDRLLYAKVLLHLEQSRQHLYGETKMKKIFSTPAAAAPPLLARVHRILGLPASKNRTLDAIVGAALLTLLLVVPTFLLLNSPGGAQQFSSQAGMPTPQIIPSENFQAPADPQGHAMPFVAPPASAPALQSYPTNQMGGMGGGTGMMGGGSMGGGMMGGGMGIVGHFPGPPTSPGEVRVEVLSLKKINRYLDPPRQEISQSPSYQRNNSSYETSHIMPVLQSVVLRDSEVVLAPLDRSGNLILVSGDEKSIARVKEILVSIEKSLQSIHEEEQKENRVDVSSNSPILVPSAAVPYSPNSGTVVYEVQESPERTRLHRVYRTTTDASPTKPQLVESMQSLFSVENVEKDGKKDEKPSTNEKQEVLKPVEIVNGEIKKVEVLPFKPGDGEKGSKSPASSQPSPVTSLYTSSISTGTLACGCEGECKGHPVQTSRISTINTTEPQQRPELPENPQWAKIEETEKKLDSFRREWAGGGTLGDLVEIFAEVDIFLALDSAHLSEIAIDENTEISGTFSWTDLPASQALNRILRPLNLVYTITVDGDVLITTPEKRDEMGIVKIYDFRDLVPQGGLYKMPQEQAETMFGSRLTQSISEQVVPPSMEVEHFSITCLGGCLSVRAPYYVHKEIRNYLESLPKAGKSGSEKSLSPPSR